MATLYGNTTEILPTTITTQQQAQTASINNKVVCRNSVEFYFSII